MKRDFLLMAYLGTVAVSVGLLLAGDQQSVALRFAEPRFQQHSPSEESPALAVRFLQPNGGPPAVHAGTITQLHDGRLLAAWFAGTREGASDVQIMMSSLTPGETHWATPTAITTREQTADELNRYIAKLGNPILFADSRKRVWLFYVTVSMGGWSGSSISLKYSDDDGVTWSPAERLVTSPFLNISTLVKGCPIECESGHLVLPVYHEFLRKFGEAMIISPEGQLVSKIRLTSEQGAIQPWIVPVDCQASVAFYRQSGYRRKQVLMNRLDDVFSSSRGPIELADVPNPDASIAVIRRPNGDYLMACNPMESGRHRLSLATSQDGLNWKILRDVEAAEPPAEYSYPYLIQTARGEYHLVFTWNRTKIGYLAFDEHWLENAP